MEKNKFLVALVTVMSVTASVAADEPAPGIQVAQWQQPYPAAPAAPATPAATAPATPAAQPGYYGAQPGYAAQPAPAAQPTPAAAPPPAPRRRRPGKRTDLGLTLPIPASDSQNSANMGVGLLGMFAIDLGWILPTFDLGWQWTPLNVPASYSDRDLTRIHFGFGLQFEIENDSLFTPVFGAMMDLNFWHVTGDTSVACTGYYYWYCYSYNEYDFTLGFTARAGVDIQVSRRHPTFTVGVGVLPSVTLSGGPFQKAEWWVSPYLTATFHH